MIEISQYYSWGGNSQGCDINNNGEVVGYIGERIDAPPKHGYIFDYDTKSLNSLGTLGGPRSSAYAINNYGQTVGYSHVSESPEIIHGGLHLANVVLGRGRTKTNPLIQKKKEFTEKTLLNRFLCDIWMGQCDSIIECYGVVGFYWRGCT